MVNTTASTLETVTVSVIDARLFRAVEQLARDAIAYGDNHSYIRAAVSRVYREIYNIAIRDHGFVTPDAVSLLRLLRRTDPRADNLNPERPPPRVDPLEDPRLVSHLTAEQLTAANDIRCVADAFAKLLTYKSRAYERGFGKKAKSKPLDPVELMGSEVYQCMVDMYNPWASGAQRRFVVSPTAGRHTHLSLVMSVLTLHYFPHELDAAMQFEKGLTLSVLREELERFWRPIRRRGLSEAERAA